MALKGLKVLEMAGLAPAPFCGTILQDFGARVIRIDRLKSATFAVDSFTRGKEAIAIDLTKLEGQKIFYDLSRDSDVIIDSGRPGMMEGLKIGPREIMAINPRLIYARLSGFGQMGSYSKKAGHDINYLALSGVLSMLGEANGKPRPPLNILGDFGGGSLLCAFGILAALIQRGLTGKGQVLDANITDGTAYLASWLWKARDLPVWGTGRGTTWFDGGVPWYDTYQCRDGKFVSVGALEKPFFDNLLIGLGIPGKYNQATSDHREIREEFTAIFRSKSRDDWTTIFHPLDACLAPVLSLDEAPLHSHHQTRQSFVPSSRKNEDFSAVSWEPRPSPRCFSATGDEKTDEFEVSPEGNFERLKGPGQHSRMLWKEMGFSEDFVEDLIKKEIVAGT